MRKLLDKMFANRRLSLIIPLAIALLMYLLFVLFGMSKNKTNLMIITPILSVVWFFGTFLVVFIQVKNSVCPEWLLNLFELFVTVIFGIYGIVNAILFVVSGFQNFTVIICLGFITYSAISLAHSKRTK